VLAIKICKRAALCICILFLCLSIAIVYRNHVVTLDREDATLNHQSFSTKY